MTVERQVLGIHHVTAVAGDLQRNIDFYAGVLGLRMVKRTVNHDDPRAYHFYYGNELGEPGTLLSFLLMPGAPVGRAGMGQATAVSLAVRPSSLEFWGDRLRDRGVAVEGPWTRNDEELLSFTDRDGLRLELVGSADPDEEADRSPGGRLSEHAIRRIHGLTISVEDAEPTVQVLAGLLGFLPSGVAYDRLRFAKRAGGAVSRVDLVATPGGERARPGVGTVHHVAWHVADPDELPDCRNEIADWGLSVTPIVDREYFESIYFREPGGLLFEVATDVPGFTLDEPAARLGSALKLPHWLESDRQSFEDGLSGLHWPGSR